MRAIAAAIALGPALGALLGPVLGPESWLSAGRAQSVLTGDAVFAAKCLRCHGDHGQGSERNPKQLAGDLSIDQLAGVIAETMPEDDPGTLSSEEAEAVAAFIHGAFYSPIARARNQPARIDLARLTVRQYRQTIADLIGSFGAAPNWGDDRGLNGEYFDSREPRGAKETKERRTDPQIDFDFGTRAAVPQIDEPRRFSIRWTGSFLAPETGDYDFTIRTEHAARLWVNDNKTPLIDAWVKSGSDTEYTASRYLVGGRVYPIRMEFTKAKQGVDDSDKKKGKKQPPSSPASVALLWRRPQSVPEVLPTRFLSPEAAPEAFVSTTTFPPDDRSLGWERGAAISEAWDEATTNAAIEALAYITDHLDRLAHTDENAKDRADKLHSFCATFAERAFRRPLDDELKKLYVHHQFEVAEDADAAVRRVVLLVLKSPRFLFRELDGKGDPYDVAARLSFGLWNSLPDQQLLKAAQAGKLTKPDDLRKQVERMLGDYRTRAKLHDFLLTWLHLDAGADLTKDPKAYPEFDAATIADVRTSLELLLDDVLSSPDADYRRLLLDDEVYLNDRLAKVYRVTTNAIEVALVDSTEEPEPSQTPSNEDEHTSVGESTQVDLRTAAALAAREAADRADAEAERIRESKRFRKVKLNDGARAGVLTHPYVMARYAYSNESSPIHRGVFLARGVLGRTLRPPPNAFVPLPAESHPDLTTRERVTLQTQSAECMTCHGIINPLGFALEHFDAVGRYRTVDREKPVDATVTYTAPDGDKAKLNGARELAEYLAQSEECQDAFIEQLFHHLIQQPVAAYGPETLGELRMSFAAHHDNIRQLAAEIMVATALRGRDTKEATTLDDTPNGTPDATPAATGEGSE